MNYDKGKESFYTLRVKDKWGSDEKVFYLSLEGSKGGWNGLMIMEKKIRQVLKMSVENRVIIRIVSIGRSSQKKWL